MTDNCENSELCFSEKVIYIMTIFIYVYINKYIHIYICIFYTFCVVCFLRLASESVFKIESNDQNN